MEVTWELLSKYASNVYSYAGEDGMIAELLKRLKIDRGWCVEFGAGDGIESSNTAVLREQGWSAHLVEADVQEFVRLDRLQNDKVICHRVVVQPTGRSSIDEVTGFRNVDLMSIDVDGSDYAIMAGLQTRPTVLIIEYNQTVPWFMDIRAKEPNNRFGASALSLYRLAQAMDYDIVGATETNLIFVHNPNGAEWSVSELGINPCFERIMLDLPNRCGFVVTDYTRHQTLINMENLPKWGFTSDKLKDELVIGPEFYPGNSPAVSERYDRERVRYS